MSSIVCFHAHPDDEALASGGTIAQLVAEQHRVTLVFATRGEVGEVDDGFLGAGTTLGEAREAEARKAAEILGVAGIEFLGYKDSGLENTVGEDEKSDEFAKSNVDEAATRLAKILDDVGADILTTYDPNGGYGHPDHIQVHRVGNRAAEMAKAKPRILWATMNRDHFMNLRETNEEVRLAMEGVGESTAEGELEHELSKGGDEKSGDEKGDASSGGESALDKSENGNEDEDEDENVAEDGNKETENETPENNFGWPESEITHFIDVTDYIDQKMDSIKAHASQIGEDSFFMKLSPEARIIVLGTEWFVDPAQKPSDKKLGSIFD